MLANVAFGKTYVWKTQIATNIRFESMCEICRYIGFNGQDTGSHCDASRYELYIICV